jgi:hypothetical protein
MKDSVILLGAGIGTAFISWALWHYLGNEGNVAILFLALIVAAADNIRLRRQLRAKK